MKRQNGSGRINQPRDKGGHLPLSSGDSKKHLKRSLSKSKPEPALSGDGHDGVGASAAINPSVSMWKRIPENTNRERRAGTVSFKHGGIKFG